MEYPMMHDEEDEYQSIGNTEDLHHLNESSDLQQLFVMVQEQQGILQ